VFRHFGCESVRHMPALSLAYTKSLKE
jgi:hypothetical protein